MNSKDLRDFQRCVETYNHKRSAAEALERGLVSACDFTLDADSCAQFTETAGIVVYAKTLEKPLRAAVYKRLQDAANDFGRLVS